LDKKKLNILVDSNPPASAGPHGLIIV